MEALNGSLLKGEHLSEISQVDLKNIWTLWFSNVLGRKRGIGGITLKVGKPSKSWTIVNIRANYSFKLEVMIISLKMKNYAKM